LATCGLPFTVAGANTSDMGTPEDGLKAPDPEDDLETQDPEDDVEVLSPKHDHSSPLLDRILPNPTELEVNDTVGLIEETLPEIYGHNTVRSINFPVHPGRQSNKHLESLG